MQQAGARVSCAQGYVLLAQPVTEMHEAPEELLVGQDHSARITSLLPSSMTRLAGDGLTAVTGSADRTIRHAPRCTAGY